MVVRLTPVLKLLNYIWATEAFNKRIPGGRRQDCHYFAHLHPFPNSVREPKHGKEEVPISDDLRMRSEMGKTSYHL